MDLMIQLVPRAVARARGYRRYFTGKPCLRGHVSERAAERKTCIACRQELQNAANARPDKKAKRAEYDRQRWINDQACLEAKNKAYYAKNADAVNAQKREYWAANREAMLAANKEWKNRNQSVYRAYAVGRKAHVKQATPPWANREAIRAVYIEADRLTEETGVKHHVDHIVPLKGKTVCGLHVAWNLRPLPWRENISKKNKMPSDRELVVNLPCCDDQGRPHHFSAEGFDS